MAKSVCFDGECNSDKGEKDVADFDTVSVTVLTVVSVFVTVNAFVTVSVVSIFFVTVTVAPPVVVVTIVTDLIFVTVLVVAVVLVVMVVILPGDVASAALSLTASINEITGGVTTAKRPHFSRNARRSAFP